MKTKIIAYFIWACSMVLLAGCQSKQASEEEVAVIEVTTAPGNLAITLEGQWSVSEPQKLEGNQICDLFAIEEATDTSITVIYEDLTQTEGGSLIRMEDYLALMQEELAATSGYTYSCGEIGTREIAGEEYYTFAAEEKTLGAFQNYYIRRMEDTMMILTVTVYGGNSADALLDAIRAI